MISPSLTRFLRVGFMLAVLPTTLANSGVAGERWFVAPLSSITWTDGNPSPLATSPWSLRSFRWTRPELVPYIQLDGEGEAYLIAQTDETGGFPESLTIVARTNAPGDVTGMVVAPADDQRGLVSSRFVLPATSASEASQRTLFLRAKAEHYELLAASELPGHAWFKHVASEARAEVAALTGEPIVTDSPVAPRFTRSFDDEQGLDTTFEMFSGARAIAENLQWDRDLRLSAQTDPTVAIASIPGITTRAFDWSKLVAGKQPELDPLAAVIPEDQYAVLCPSFAAYLGLADELERRASPLVDLFAVQATRGLPREKYEAQFALGLSTLARLFGDHFVKSVAMTGGDVDFDSGTDLAILFESEKPDALLTLLKTKLDAAASTKPEATREDGEVEGVTFYGVRTPDRALSSYVARVGPAIVVTNSKAQLAALARAANGSRGSLAKLDEYRFFRDRYARGSGENALVLLTDPTIRRWCSPAFRIASSRRARAALELAELHARSIDHGKLDEVDAKAKAALEATYGSMHFVTPTIELTIDKVTQVEADAYARFRNGYQANWSNYFDPIALRIAIDDVALDTDLTVMPLIAGSDFREFTEVTEGVTLKAGDGDPHPESIAHYVQAINTESSLFQMGRSMFEGMTGEIDVSPLAWISNHFAVYFDDAPIWDDLAKLRVDDSDFEDLLEERLNDIPLAIEVGVKDALGCAAFLTFVRTYANESAPGLVRFKTKEYGDSAYVQISGDIGAGRGANGEPLEHSVFYCVSSKSLTLSLNEDVIKRAIDRRSAPAQAAAPLGESLTLELKRRVLDSLMRVFHDEVDDNRRVAAWRALPILNEWKRLFPSEDPVAVHQRLWGETLVEPSGGSFVWNEQARTMESSSFGHPLAAKDAPPAKPFTELFSNVNFGLTFEHDGLRAHMRIAR